MDWLILWYAIGITLALLLIAAGFVWLIIEYEDESYVAILILACVAVIILVVSGVYLILKAGGQ